MSTPLLNISLKEPENFLKNSAPSACRCSIFVKFRVKSAAYSQPVCSRLTIESHYLLQICFSFASDFRIFQSVSLNSAVLPFPSSTVSKLCRLATLQFRISAVSQPCCVATVLTNSSIFLNSRTAGKTARQKQLQLARPPHELRTAARDPPNARQHGCQRDKNRSTFHVRYSGMLNVAVDSQRFSPKFFSDSLMPFCGRYFLQNCL